MSKQRSPDRLEERLEEAAASFRYPATPDIAGAVRERLAAETADTYPSRRGSSRRLGWALALLLVVVAGVAATPPARARILALLRIGSISIVVPTASPVVVATTPAAASPTATVRPVETPTQLSPRLNLYGETTLAEAQQELNFPVRLPTYPADLGAPDGVYVQDLGGPAVILVWLEPGSSGRVAMSLHQLTQDVFAEKEVQSREHIENTSVNGRPAVWVRGEHVLQFRAPDGGFDTRFRRLVQGNVLIWVEGEITYRLETELPLEEAVRVAESLR